MKCAGACAGLLVWMLVGSLPAWAEDPAAGEGRVTFEAGTRGSKLEPRFSAMSTEVALKATAKGPLPGLEAVDCHLLLGPRPGVGRRVVLMRTTLGKPYDQLLADTDGDGSLEDEEVVPTELRSSGKSTWSTFEVALQIDHGTAGAPLRESYAIGLYVVVKDPGARPEAIYYTCHGYRSGRVHLGDAEYDVVLSDRNNDAVYGTGDAWTIRSVEKPEPYKIADSRKVGDFAWAGGKAWRLELEGSAGRAALVLPHDAKVTPEKDAKDRDPNWEDRQAPRADAPLTFVRDLKEGRRQALKEGAPYFVQFEAAQSLACKEMHELVYNAKAVVEAAKGLVCVQIDGLADEKTSKQFDVEEYPTGILFDPAGKVVARFTGYQGGEAFQAFLSEVHSYLKPSDNEPKLRGKAKKRHAKVVKRHYDFLEDSKGHGLLSDRIRTLGTHKTRGIRDALIRFATKRKSKEYIAAAFFALGGIGGSKSIEFLCGPKALASGDFLVAEKAAEALAEAKDPAATQPILAVMTNRRTKIEIVRACALALARSSPKNDEVVQAILEFSKNKKDTIRAGAVEALGYLRVDEAIPRLREALFKDKNTRVRQAAAWGIGHTARPELIPALREALAKDNAHTVRTACLDAIAELQGEKKR